MLSNRLFRVTAIVIRHRDLGETDQILTLLSRQRGKLRAVAKGVKRPKSKLAAATQLFSHSRFLIAQGRNLDVVSQAEIIESFYGLRDDLAKVAYASYFAELADAVVQERQPAEAIYDLLLAALRQVEGACRAGLPRPAAGTRPPPYPPPRRGEASVNDDLERLARVFELSLLSLSGFEPELSACAQCGAEVARSPGGFSPPLGGVVCTGCAPRVAGVRPLSAAALEAARRFSKAAPGLLPRAELSPRDRAQLRAALRSHLEYRLDRKIRSRRFIDDLEGDDTPRAQ